MHAYHATREAFVPSILRDGLRSSEANQPRGVYFVLSRLAAHVILTLYSGRPIFGMPGDGPIVILTVDIPDGTAMERDPMIGYAVVVPHDIPPRWITAVEPVASLDKHRVDARAVDFGSLIDEVEATIASREHAGSHI